MNLDRSLEEVSSKETLSLYHTAAVSKGLTSSAGGH